MLHRTVPSAALVLTGTMVLAACSGAGTSGSGTTSANSSVATSMSASTGAASSASSPSTSTPSSSSTSSSTPSSSAPSSSITSSSAPRSPSKPPVSQALINACVNANARSNSAVTQWNGAVRTQKSDDLDKAAANFRTTATYLRTLTKAPGDKGLTPLVWKVAKDFDDMADARTSRRTVSTSTYNADAQKLRQYCTTKIAG